FAAVRADIDLESHALQHRGVDELVGGIVLRQEDPRLAAKARGRQRGDLGRGRRPLQRGRRRGPDVVIARPFKDDPEPAALALWALDLDPTVHGQREALTDGEAQSGPAGTGRAGIGHLGKLAKKASLTGL